MNDQEESDLSEISNYEQSATEDEDEEEFVNPLPYENFPRIIDIGKLFFTILFS